ncbi:baseplate multidomain protein megatron [Algirhabdus cladophorae]|uniref:baseplate multidomain protein megatron n=1 Tax=Algirhabdus cladophorae TaxID=3377108 RepID=UPI003B846825
MATLLLSAAGMAVGGSVGGSVLGLSSAVAGRFIGASIGQLIDQRLMGGGSDVVETGQVDRFRLTGASEGTAIGQVFGRMRVGGQVIWSSPFRETVTTSGGSGKGTPQPKTKTYSYSVSLAIALCEGQITRVGRIWADGIEISKDDLNLRVYTGSQTQSPDPTIAAFQGTSATPAYRGTAYVVMENLALGQFGNRVPQFSMEVMRGGDAAETETSDIVKAVAMIPGTGEYALATTPVHMRARFGQYLSANVNSPSGKTDFVTSTDALNEELPNCGAVSLIVSWFGDDLRCGHCKVQPKVEQKQTDGRNMQWWVSSTRRADAGIVPQQSGRPIYGGSPADTSVIQAIQRLKATGQKPMFYPFILMEQTQGNSLPNPYTGEAGQPVLPWRGRITTSLAPTMSGTPDQTATARSEVAAFFGTASPSDFSISANTVSYSGPDEWSYRRFILHYAYLCKAAGGVSAFCIGSEMRGLTQIRDDLGFPAVVQLRQLAGEVRQILGAGTKISYASDWSEYFGYQPNDGSGDRFFHLDPLWADDAIDFIGIDNYMPLSDWRDTADHADVEAGSIYNLEYLMGNVQGGEGYDWYYASETARQQQIRTPIEDGTYQEPWIYRYKDIQSWWSQPHFERVAGVRSEVSTQWQPQSKPIWFTELGCAAIDKGTNQPNKFLDPKSSESRLPYFSNGQQDDFMQAQYIRAMHGYWEDATNNPISDLYAAPMVDMSNAFIWAWDARPYPYFPNNRSLWTDGDNYAKGHWLNGRATARSLASIVTEVVEKSGVQNIDTARLFGTVQGYQITDISSARAALQPLLLVYGIDVVERAGVLVFQNRSGAVQATFDASDLVFDDAHPVPVEASRVSEGETVGRVRLGFVESEAAYETRSVEAAASDKPDTAGVSQSNFDLAMTRGVASRVADRWLTEARIARESYQFALPMSQNEIGAGDTVALNWEGATTYARIDNVQDNISRQVDATRVDIGVYEAPEVAEVEAVAPTFTAIGPVDAVFLDVPLLTGDETPHAPHVALVADPWPGGAAVYTSSSTDGFAFNTLVQGSATFGELLTPLELQAPGHLHRLVQFDVSMIHGELTSVDELALMAGANTAFLSQGDPDLVEVLQFLSADLIDPGTYRITGVLRGQAGSDGIAPKQWPIGSYFTLMNPAVVQLDLATALRGTTQTLRFGPSSRGYADATYSEEEHSFSGNGLRPYRPCHAKVDVDQSGDIAISWIRRTRKDGDNWSGIDVPLAEETEAYLISVVQNGENVRQLTTTQPQWTYLAADALSDLQSGAYTIEIAQISAVFGAGPSLTIERLH